MSLLTSTSDVCVSQMGLAPWDSIRTELKDIIFSSGHGTDSSFKLLLNIVFSCAVSQIDLHFRTVKKRDQVVITVKYDKLTFKSFTVAVQTFWLCSEEKSTAFSVQRQHKLLASRCLPACSNRLEVWLDLTLSLTELHTSTSIESFKTGAVHSSTGHFIMTISGRELGHCFKVKACGGCLLKANFFLAAVRAAHTKYLCGEVKAVGP